MGRREGRPPRSGRQTLQRRGKHTEATSDRPARPSFFRQKGPPAESPATGRKPAFWRQTRHSDLKVKASVSKTIPSRREAKRTHYHLFAFPTAATRALPRRELHPRPLRRGNRRLRKTPRPRKTILLQARNLRPQTRMAASPRRPFSRDNDSRSAPSRIFPRALGAEGRPDRGPAPTARPSAAPPTPRRSRRQALHPAPPRKLASPRYRKFDAPRGDRPSRPSLIRIVPLVPSES